MWFYIIVIVILIYRPIFEKLNHAGKQVGPYISVTVADRGFIYDANKIG